MLCYYTPPPSVLNIIYVLDLESVFLIPKIFTMNYSSHFLYPTHLSLYVGLWNANKISISILIILSGSYEALRGTVYLGKLDINDLTIRLLSLSILSYFNGKRLRLLNHLFDEKT
jgi:hypothetical protein